MQNIIYDPSGNKLDKNIIRHIIYPIAISTKLEQELQKKN